MIKIGDIIEQNGISYKIDHVGKVGPNIRKRGIIKSLVLTPSTGKTFCMAWVFDDWTVGRVFQID